MQAEALTLSVEIPRPAENKPDSAATRREKTIRDLADMMINQRLSKLSKAEGAPFISAESYSYEYLEFVSINGIQAQCDPKNWQATLTLLETELRRAIEHGFTDDELAEARATILKGAKLRADQADSRKSRDLASGLVSILAGKKVFTHPADDHMDHSIAASFTEAALEGTSLKNTLLHYYIVHRGDWPLPQG